MTGELDNLVETSALDSVLVTFPTLSSLLDSSLATASVLELTGSSFFFVAV